MILIHLTPFYELMYLAGESAKSNAAQLKIVVKLLVSVFDL